MIAYTVHGLLYLTADCDAIEALISKPDTYLQVWFCPTGCANPEWVDNAIRIEQLLDAHVWDDFIGDWEPARQGPLVLPERCEEVLRRELGDRFIGPIEGVPGPSVDTRATLNRWFSGVMYQLTKHGDHHPSESD
jgi:hypothetical protein